MSLGKMHFFNKYENSWSVMPTCNLDSELNTVQQYSWNSGTMTNGANQVYIYHNWSIQFIHGSRIPLSWSTCRQGISQSRQPHRQQNVSVRTSTPLNSLHVWLSSWYFVPVQRFFFSCLHVYASSAQLRHCRIMKINVWSSGQICYSVWWMISTVDAGKEMLMCRGLCYVHNRLNTLINNMIANATHILALVTEASVAVTKLWLRLYSNIISWGRRCD